VQDYDIPRLTGDLTGLLDALGEERAFVVGHDWGAIVAWQLAVLAPERVRAVAAMSVPFTPRPPVPPIELFHALSGDRFFYILYFQEPGAADKELDADPRWSLRKLMTGAGWGGGAQLAADVGLLDRIKEPDSLPDWLSEEDLDVYAGEFERTGFTGPLNWYRNFDRNWELTAEHASAHVRQPALFVTGDKDPVRRFAPAQLMEGWVDDLRGSHVLEGCGHWTQQESPHAVNAFLLEFLSSV
jgi:pimeloyl-ACP methyl ester carboxylesterase